MQNKTTTRGTRTKEAAKPVPEHEWLEPSALMNFDDPALRAMARSFMNAQKSDRDRALAAHAYVRALALAFPHQSRPATASVVMRRREGDAVDKATLLVALLRLCEVPARLVFGAPGHEALRGLPVDVCCSPRPMVEAFIEGHWLRTDTFIFDERYVRAAHHRLHQKHRESGYGVSAAGAVHWDATRSVSLLGADHVDGIEADAPRYHDAADYAASLGVVQRITQLGRWVAWTSQRRRLEKTLRNLRARQPAARARPAAGQPQSVPG